MNASHCGRHRSAPWCLDARRAARGLPRSRSIRRGLFVRASLQTVIERRASDVLIVGDSALAYCIAYTIAKRGVKVILVPDFGLQAARPLPAPLHPLKLTHADALLAGLAAEAAAYWRGLEVVTQARLLQPCPALDFVLDAGDDHAAAAAFQALQEGSQAAGVRAALLRPDEVAAQTDRLVGLPPDAAGLLQPDGGVVRAAEAVHALSKLAQRAGVDVKERLKLRGWRDAGDHFVVSASSDLLPDSLSSLEAEQLVLAPGSWQPACLALFGLDTAMALRQLEGGRWPAAGELQQLPLWNFLGGPGTQYPEAPGQAGGEGAAAAPGSSANAHGGRGTPAGRGEAGPASSRGPATSSSGSRQPASSSSSAGSAGALLQVGGEGVADVPCWGLPLLSAGARLRVGQLAWQGTQVDSPFGWRPPLAPPAGDAASAQGGGSSSSSSDARASGSSSGSGGQARGDDEAGSAMTPALRVMHEQAARFVRGVGTAPDVRPTVQLLATTSDGRPALGWHPGFEPGRALVACEAAGSTPGQSGLPACVLTPALARLAADALAGLPGADQAAAAFDLGRPAVAADAAALAGGLDCWEGLGALQRPVPLSREAAEEAADLAEERRRDEERRDGRVQGGSGAAG